MADFDPSLVWIASQPLLLTGRDGAMLRQHAPDLLLAMADETFMLVDVKPKEFAQEPRGGLSDKRCVGPGGFHQ